MTGWEADGQLTADGRIGINRPIQYECPQSCYVRSNRPVQLDSQASGYQALHGCVDFERGQPQLLCEDSIGCSLSVE